MNLGFEAPATPAALVELEARAGASDRDYEVWKAERRRGITATQVRDLYLGVEKVQTLVDIKLGRRPDPFIANRHTEWGNTREPVLAERAAWAYGIAPEHRVFRAADNDRFLASPDGIGVGPDGSLRVAEYKTSKHAIGLGTHALDKKGYIAQMQWVMRVTGASRCLYVWEQHNDDWVDVGKRFPEPSGILQSHEHWVDYDPVMVLELEQIAADFLAELDRQAAGGAPTHDPADYEALAAKYLYHERRAAYHQEQMAAVKEQIAERIGGAEGFSVRTTEATVTYVTPAPRRSLDEAAWAKRAPKQHEAWLAARERYVKETPVKPYVKITATTDKDKEKE